jgi:hypothetical protein
MFIALVIWLDKREQPKRNAASYQKTRAQPKQPELAQSFPVYLGLPTLPMIDEKAMYLGLPFPPIIDEEVVPTQMLEQ